ncbi:MAG: hypothetical protein QGG25_18810, partial [Phycisphaerae bacterium]|nr:hypothetical protein [Phycisphaerae bacterium]
DDEFLFEIHNLERKVNQAVKHPESVMRVDAPWNTPEDCFDYVNVLYDESEGLFKMWYAVLGSCGKWGTAERSWAYATSTDGINWERPILNMAEVNGSTENNYFLPEMNNLCWTLIMDPSDRPSRRYKMMFCLGDNPGVGEQTDWADFHMHMPLNLAYSADGLTWAKPQHVNPVLRGISDGGWGFIYDPDRRKYVLFTRRVPNLPRDISMYESSDLVNWEDRGRVLVPGDEYDPPSLFNFQSMTPFFYEDFHLGLLSTQYSLPGAELYEVYHKPPADYGDQRMGTVNVQMAYSRDGLAWSRPNDRSEIIPTGEPGAPDAGMIFIPQSSPPVVDGETWIYYTACRDRHSMWDQKRVVEEDGGRHSDHCCCMLAKMPEDHWVSLDAGAEEGSLLTKPMAFAIWQDLLVNADAGGGYIEAELVTPYGQVIEGFARGDCVPVTGDGKDQPLRWKGPKSVAEIMPDHVGGPCIRFYLKNAKLYSFTVTEPDPDGARARYWDDMRWCEIIKHRSDNWSRTSNSPAGGVPPYTQPGPGKPRI